MEWRMAAGFETVNCLFGWSSCAYHRANVSEQQPAGGRPNKIGSIDSNESDKSSADLSDLQGSRQAGQAFETFLADLRTVRSANEHEESC
jgi:hypothetical protein